MWFRNELSSLCELSLYTSISYKVLSENVTTMRCFCFSPVMSMSLQVFAASPILWFSVSHRPFPLTRWLCVPFCLSVSGAVIYLVSLPCLFLWTTYRFRSCCSQNMAVDLRLHPVALSVCSFDTRLLKYVLTIRRLTTTIRVVPHS